MRVPSVENGEGCRPGTAFQNEKPPVGAGGGWGGMWLWMATLR